MACVSVRRLAVQKRRDLFGYKADQKYDHGGTEQQQAHVGKSPHCRERVPVVTKAHREEECRSWQKQLKGGIQRRDLEDDQQKSQAILQWFDVTFTFPFGGLDIYKIHRVAGADEGHGDCRGIGKSVG